MRGVQTFSLSTCEAEQLSGDGPFSVVSGMGGGGGLPPASTKISYIFEEFRYDDD
jgi:hypothetical protein